MKKFENVLKYLGSGVIVYVVFTMCNPGNNSDSDAIAQDAGTNGDCCNIPSQIRTVSADQDPAQMVRGSLEISSVGGGPLAEGPFVLTDASTGNGGEAILFVVPNGDPCEPGAFGLQDEQWVATVTTDGPISGARIVIPSGQTLCTYGTYNSTHYPLAWAGFHPY